MAMSQNLFTAILAMDSYNRGYNTGVNLGENTQIGTASISNQLLDQALLSAKTAGFFAFAYTYNGETVISYRGTDNQTSATDQIAGGSDLDDDLLTGGLGLASGQTALALDFYARVTGANPHDAAASGVA